MRVLALGGCGQEGKNAVQDLLERSPDVTEIIIADLNGARAAELASHYGSRVRAVQLDVNDKPALLSAMTDCDVVSSFVGPYYRFGRQILQASIEAKRNFVDICDDPEATLEELDLDDAAKAAGISAVVGMGASPGMFNVVAAYGAQYLDHVEDIELEWCVSVTDFEDTGVSAAMSHVFHMINGDHPQFVDGQMVNLPAMSGEKTIYYPLFGETIGYYVGHPEPLTLPRYFPGLKNATNRGSIPGLDDLLRAFRATGLASNMPIKLPGGEVRPRDVASALLAIAPLPPLEQLPPPNAGGRIIVRGTKDGQFHERQYLIMEPLNMGPNTGFSAAIGIAMMGRGQITTKGVFAPEGGVDPNVFMAELERRNYKWEETVITKRMI